MSDAVHLYSRYLEELRVGNSKTEAISIMLRDTGTATFLTSLTTAIGFGSLYFTGIPVLQEFGLITGAGVLAAFVIAITLLPALLVVLPQPSRIIVPGNFVWRRSLKSFFIFSAKNRKIVLITSAVITLAAVLISSHIELNNFLLEDLKKTEPLRQDFAYLKRTSRAYAPLNWVFHAFPMKISYPLNTSRTLAGWKMN